MDQSELRNFFIIGRDTITTLLSTFLPLVLPANIFSTPYGVPSVANIPSSTPKIDRVRFITLSSGFMTYTYMDSRFSRFSDLF